MLEMLLDKKLLFVLMGILTGLGVVDKCIVSMTMKRMVEAAGSMSKSNHPLMRLVRAKFEHGCMVSDKVQATNKGDDYSRSNSDHCWRYSRQVTLLFP